MTAPLTDAEREEASLCWGCDARPLFEVDDVERIVAAREAAARAQVVRDVEALADEWDRQRGGIEGRSFYTDRSATRLRSVLAKHTETS